MSKPPSMTGTEMLVCAVAGLGFAFDLYESLMMALIVGPALTTLGGFAPGSAPFNLWVGLLFFVPAVAGGLFGLLGGYLTDLVGRRRLLTWSILLYAGSAAAAAFATSLPMFLALRSLTLIGVCVEAVAAVAWLAELFPEPRRRELVLAWTQACYPLGGLMLGGAYFLAVTYAEALPAIQGGHDAWRYTLLSGLIPALPLVALRPFLPESPAWRTTRRERRQRPSLAALWQPGTRGLVVVTALLAACTLAVPYGALQHVPRIVPAVLDRTAVSPREVQQAVSAVFVVQELGSIAGRLLFAAAVVRIASRRRLFRLFVAPCLVACASLAFAAVHGGIVGFAAIVFCAQALFNGMHSFWGNYLPRVFPTRLRGTGESIALNIGGRVLAVTAALLTTQLSNVVPAASIGLRLAYSAGITATLALMAAMVISRWLPEPAGERLPD